MSFSSGPIVHQQWTATFGNKPQYSLGYLRKTWDGLSRAIFSWVIPHLWSCIVKQYFLTLSYRQGFMKEQAGVWIQDCPSQTFTVWCLHCKIQMPRFYYKIYIGHLLQWTLIPSTPTFMFIVRRILFLI